MTVSYLTKSLSVVVDEDGDGSDCEDGKSGEDDTGKDDDD